MGVTPEYDVAWRKVLPTLADRYRVVAPDLRGMGTRTSPRAAFAGGSLRPRQSGPRLPEW